jgi:hypothetical protein
MYKSNQITALLKNAIVKLEIEKTATPRWPILRLTIGNAAQKTLLINVDNKGIKYIFNYYVESLC